MKKNTLTAIAGFWLITIAGAYYIGQQNQTAAVSASGAKGSLVATSNSDRGSADANSPSLQVADSSPWKNGGAAGGVGESPAQALARLRASFSNLNAIERNQAFLAALDGLDNEGFKEAYELIRAQDEGGAGRYQSMMLFYAWGRKDPEAALAYTKESGNERANFAVLSSWAEVAPTRAIDWAKANAPVDEQGNPRDNWNMVGVISGLSRTDLGLAANALEGMNFGEARGRALDTVFDRMWKQDPEQAKNWVSSLGDERLKAGAAERVADRLADSDPAAAAAWVETLPQSPARAQAAASIIEEWSGRDPNATGEWVNNQFPAGAENDRVREAFAYSIDNRDPQSSLAWAATITDQRRREETLSRISRDWLRRDADNARAVLSTMPDLPANVRERLNRR